MAGKMRIAKIERVLCNRLIVIAAIRRGKGEFNGRCWTKHLYDCSVC